MSRSGARKAPEVLCHYWSKAARLEERSCRQNLVLSGRIVDCLMSDVRSSDVPFCEAPFAFHSFLAHSIHCFRRLSLRTGWQRIHKGRKDSLLFIFPPAFPPDAASRQSFSNRLHPLYNICKHLFHEILLVIYAKHARPPSHHNRKRPILRARQVEAKWRTGPISRLRE